MLWKNKKIVKFFPNKNKNEKFWEYRIYLVYILRIKMRKNEKNKKNDYILLNFNEIPYVENGRYMPLENGRPILKVFQKISIIFDIYFKYFTLKLEK